ncbi:hypothetical protein P1J78_02035 [Psychromarinibacter sp. C21-152]|uniref:Uncharacterized protein n=1 Tax=Psychromarinibacter sediminicola TaxID=3033385 RepID=A0AAE3T7Y0_9RHOB|nr:hypothetical protein [Psychromarinibacter sediminicola]MDF0599499.1 hypothetical protein [Psychromarinibacter sediminicola]
MCLTTEALLLFLSLLPSEIVETSADRIVVRAEVSDAVWLPNGREWCTDARETGALGRSGPRQPT